MSSGSQSDYRCFDELIRRLRVEGYDEPAKRLHALLHEVAWTTGSELLGELGLVISAFERGRPKASPDLRSLLDSCFKVVKEVWPRIN